MPKRRADDIPRMVMTDHFIRRRPPLKLVDLPAPSRKLYQGEVAAYHPSPLPATGENALYKAVAQVGLGNNVEAGLPRLRAEIEKQKPRNPQFYLVLGDALKATGRQEEAAAAYGAALKLQPNSVRALRSLGTEDALKKALQLAPGDPESWYRYGLLDAKDGRFTEAVDKIRKAIALDPSLPEKSRRLGEILLQAGDVAGAQEAVREALRIDPYDDDAWDLAGRLHSQKREVAEAMFAFERTIKLRPGSASHLYDYGLALARAARFEDAQKQAEAAIRADDRLAEAHELLGGLFETIGRAQQAVEEYRRAVTLKPDLSRTQLRLGNMLQGQGDREGAAERFREAAKSSDTAIAQQAQRALQQLGAQ